MTPQTPYVPGVQPEEPFTLQQMARPGTPKRRRVWPLVVIVAVLVLVGAGTAVYALTRDEPAAAVDKTAALIAACREVALKDLKSPATAVFSGEKPVEFGDRFYYIEGVVDSQNSFGATVRTNYRCKAEAVGDGWSVVRVEFSTRA